MTLEKNMIEKLKTTLFSVLLVLLTVMTAFSAFAAERITYIHFDALGSAIAGSDAEGASVWREDYQPYGDRIVSDGSTGNNLWYTGKASFENFGLSYFGARWYDPVVGRFTGIDPVGYQEDNIHSFNRYAYANNNPYKFVDPDGRAAFLVPLVVFILKEAAGEAFEQATGVSTPTVKNLGKKIVKAATKKGVTKSVGKATSKSNGVIHVTKNGVALPSGSKYKIPNNYAQNPHRSGSYGEIVNGKFKERLRIDPPTPPGQKGPNYSHYHKNGKGTHYSPRAVDKDPGF